MRQELIDILHKGHHSLVVSGEIITTFDGRGVVDLYRLVTGKTEMLHHADVLDKVVGKGAAALLVLGNVQEVYAEMISSPALALLRENGVQVSFAKEVPYILNRKGDGLCPVEQLCADCLTAKDCLSRIADFLENSTKH